MLTNQSFSSLNFKPACKCRLNETKAQSKHLIFFPFILDTSHQKFLKIKLRNYNTTLILQYLFGNYPLYLSINYPLCKKEYKKLLCLLTMTPSLQCIQIECRHKCFNSNAVQSSKKYCIAEQCVGYICNSLTEGSRQEYEI